MATEVRRSKYDVIAVRYATLTASRRDMYFRYQAYGEPDGSIQMDYYFWIVKNAEHTILVDTGFSSDVGRRRGRAVLTEPLDALRRAGTDPDEVDTIVVTHMHYDHVGNLALFPGASIVMARPEYDFWMGPFAKRTQFAEATETAELEYVRQAYRDGRVTLLDGDQELLPGVDVRVVGGHCPGQLIVLIKADGGPIVLASDTLHFYEEMERDMPFSVLYHLADMYKTYDLLHELETGAHATVVSGHDPLVMHCYPPLPTAPDIAVKIGEMG